MHCHSDTNHSYSIVLVYTYAKYTRGMLEHFGVSANEDCSSPDLLVLGCLSSSSRSLASTACLAAFSTVSSSSTSVYSVIEVTRDLHVPGPRMRIAEGRSMTNRQTDRQSPHAH